MKHLFRKVLENPLISGSAIIFLGSNLANVFNLLFNFFMVRNLSDADFGELTSLNSIVLLPLLIATALSPIVINFAAGYFGRGELDLVHGFYAKMVKYLLIGCSVFLCAYMLGVPYIADFFHIHNHTLIIVTGLIVSIGLFSTLNLSFLQAKLAFLFIAAITLVAAVAKFGLGVGFVMQGSGVAGGIWAILLSLICLLALSFWPLRFVLKKKSKDSPVPRRELVSYGVPSALAVLGLTAFITTDIFLVKHFFHPDEAGIYAGIELVAKIIYFLTASIATVMFPVVVQKRSKNEEYDSTFLLAIALVAIPSALITCMYFLFPDFVIMTIIKKESTLQHGSLLGVFGIFMSLYSLVALFVNFYLSIRKTVVAVPVCLVALLQIAAVWMFHESFAQIIWISLILMFVLLLGLLLYYPHARKK